MTDDMIKDQADVIEDGEMLEVPEDETEPERPAREVDGNRETFGFLIRGLAGAYVIYLAYKIMKDMIAKGDIRWYMVLACVVFVAAGGFFLFMSLRYMMRIRKENEEAAAKKEQEALEREKLFAENPELRARYEAEQAQKAADSGSGAAGYQGRRGLFGGMAGAAAANMQPRSLTGSDIRERLRQMNEEDGLETEDISVYAEEAAETEDGIAADEAFEEAADEEI